MKIKQSVLLSSTILASLCIGCATVPTKYQPKTLGTVDDGSNDSELVVTISPRSDVVLKGDPIRFSVEVKNAATHEVLIPNQPDIHFLWTYSNGIKDNYLSDSPEERFYLEQDLVRLAPGETKTFEVPVKTYYFNEMGITEFTAMLQSARNTNPAVGNVWQGRVFSNRYGMMITKDRNKTAGRSSERYAGVR